MVLPQTEGLSAHLAHLTTQCYVEAQRTERTLESLLQALAELESGAWVGSEANTFYGEMREVVLPALMCLRALLLKTGEQAAKAANGQPVNTPIDCDFRR